METIELKKEQIREVAKRAVNMLKNAPLTEEGDYIKVYLHENGDLENVVIAGNSYIPNTIQLASVKYVHPDYNSESYMKEAGVEATEENVREWDWNNFFESNDMQNNIEYLYEDILDFIDRDFPMNPNNKFEIDLID